MTNRWLVIGVHGPRNNPIPPRNSNAAAAQADKSLYKNHGPR